tara:strand:- start:976 stop:2574 length:1599 start_codon:yes stop_codon:yes gene_type:complete
MKGVWEAITREHIVTFLIIFSLITIVGYIPEEKFSISPTGFASYSYGCQDSYNTIQSQVTKIPTKTDVGACCLRTEDCVSDHTGTPTCYSAGGIDYDRDGLNDAYCLEGIWIDCDSDFEGCTRNLRCGFSNSWSSSGEASVGEYPSIEALSCCGDDSGEYSITSATSPYGSVCCNSNTDKIENGACVASTTNAPNENCADGVDNDDDDIIDELDTDCDGEWIDLTDIDVSKESVDEDDTIKVHCDFDSNSNIKNSQIKECIYVTIDGDKCDDVDFVDDDNIIFECDVGDEGSDKDVLCLVNDDCNAKDAREKTSIDVSGESCTDEDGDNYCKSFDCRDDNPFINPGIIESCDGIDNNCNDITDENCCSDGRLNGGESQVDCGGLYCASCGSIVVNDNFPSPSPDNDDDWDNDGLSNRQELTLGTDPNDPDTDGDGVFDGEDPEPLISFGDEDKEFPVWVIIIISVLAIILIVGTVYFLLRKGKQKGRYINNPRVIEFIRVATKRHVPKSEIERMLKDKGWDATTIREGFKKA